MGLPRSTCRPAGSWTCSAPTRPGATPRWRGCRARRPAGSDARIAVAAEVGASYNALRACEALVVQTEADTRSRAETARVTELAAKAGLSRRPVAALARASAAQGRSLLAGQQAQCELRLKALVALTGLAEPRLRRKLACALARRPRPAADRPACRAERAGAALMQRPDLVVAERQIGRRGRGRPRPAPALPGGHRRPAAPGVRASTTSRRGNCGPSARCGVAADLRRRHARGQRGRGAGALRRSGGPPTAPACAAVREVERR